MNTIRQELAALADETYRNFQAALLPTVDKTLIMGVRTPVLRRYAKQLQAQRPQEAQMFLAQLPHTYYEENNLHMELLALQKTDIRTKLAQVEAFLPYIDNWATCDGRAGVLFAKYPAEAQTAAFRWLQSERPYTVRFGMVTLLGFVRTAFEESHLAAVAAAVTSGVCGEEYYVRMAAAWYVSMALVHQWENTLPWIAQHKLPVWVHNKAIQKACESYQLPQEKKEILRGHKSPQTEE